jgi:hypothetical protein
MQAAARSGAAFVEAHPDTPPGVPAEQCACMQDSARSGAPFVEAAPAE